MKLNSIRFKLLLIIISAFMFTTIAILTLTKTEIIETIDQHHEAIYTEKTEGIYRFLEGKYNNLKKTGLIEVYTNDFKKSAVDILELTLYGNAILSPPTILDSSYQIVMHSTLPVGKIFIEQDEIKSKLSSKSGQFTAKHQGETKWFIYKKFEPWNWTILYSIPVNTKYNDFQGFLTKLIAYMTGIALLVSILLSIFIAKFTKPIINLTNISTLMAAGNLEQKIEIDRNDELGILAQSFNNMCDSIKRQVEALNNEINERKLIEKKLLEAKGKLNHQIKPKALSLPILVMS